MDENKNITYIIMYIYCKESTSKKWAPITVTNIFSSDTRFAEKSPIVMNILQDI